MYLKGLFVLGVLVIFNSTGNTQATASCQIKSMPTVMFKNGDVFLTASAKKELDIASKTLQANPGCKVRIASLTNPSIVGQVRSFDRVMSIAWYLQSKGVEQTRMILEYGAEGNPLVTNLVAVDSSEEGPSSLTVPVACLSYHKVYNKGKRCVDAKGNFTEMTDKN